MQPSRFVSAALVIQAAVAYAPAANADNKATAEQLFQEAKKLMDAGKHIDACPKLEASQKLDPADGTQLRLALCYQAIGRWASAWGLFREGLQRAQKANRKDRIELATKGIADVEPRMSRLKVNVPADARVPSLSVKLDDEVYPEGALGAPLPVDPGSHVVSASAPGFQAWSETVVIGTTAEERSVIVPKLAPVAAPSATPVAAPVVAPPPTTVESAPSSNMGGYVAVGAGVLFLGGALGMRLVAGGARDDYFAGCAQQQTPVCDDAAGRSRVRTWETLSWVSAGVGVAAIGVGVVLLVNSKKGDAHAVTAAPIVVGGGGGLGLSGSF